MKIVKRTIIMILFSSILVNSTASWAEEIKDCYHVSTEGRAMGTGIGAFGGIAVGGGLCAAGLFLAGISFGVTAIVGCAGVAQ